MSRPPGDDTLSTALAAFARNPDVLVALDFDGCLAPFVLDPADARPLPEASAALRALAASDGVQLALVSGRPTADLAALADPPPGTWLIGSHGAEVAEVTRSGDVVLTPFELTADERALREQVTAEVTAIASAHPGSRVEHKPAAVALHTRGMPPADAEHALTRAMEGPGRRAGVHAMRGNQVAELAVVAVTKGDGLERLRARLADERGARAGIPVLYAGDDVTDERALATLRQGDVGVKVGAAPTVAEHRVHDERAVAEMLTALAGLVAARARE